MAFTSSLMGPVQPASQIYAKKKLHSHQTRAWGWPHQQWQEMVVWRLGAALLLGSIPTFTDPPGKWNALLSGLCRAHMNVCTAGGRRDQGCVGALWCTKTLSKFWHFSLRDKALVGIYLKPFSFSETLFFLGPFIEGFKSFLEIPNRESW